MIRSSIILQKPDRVSGLAFVGVTYLFQFRLETTNCPHKLLNILLGGVEGGHPADYGIGIVPNVEEEVF